MPRETARRPPVSLRRDPCEYEDSSGETVMRLTDRIMGIREERQRMRWTDVRDEKRVPVMS